MTTDTTTKPTREQLEKAVAEASSEVTNLTAANQKMLTDMAASGNFDLAKVGDAAASLKAAETRRDRATAALQAFIVSDVWENSADIRQPVLDMLRTVLVDNRPVVKAASASGRITIDKQEDGTFKASGPMRVRFEAYDESALAAQIVGLIDAETLAGKGITAIDVDVTDIGGKNEIKLSPATDKAKVAAANVSGERAGGLEYQYGNDWLGTRALLERVQIEHPELVTRWQGRFDAFNKPGSNGMSNLGKDVAKALGLTSREKAPAA